MKNLLAALAAASMIAPVAAHLEIQEYPGTDTQVEEIQGFLEDYCGGPGIPCVLLSPLEALNTQRTFQGLLKELEKREQEIKELREALSQRGKAI